MACSYGAEEIKRLAEVRLKVLFAGLAGLLFAASTQAATRLAVVDVGSKEQVPAAFLDLLTVELSRQPDVVLLERTEVNKLFREQALGLSISGDINSKEAVNAGRLWATDAFLMLEAEHKTNQKTATLRIRLVDTRYGLKLWDMFWPVETNATAQAARLAIAVVPRLAKLTCRANEPITVAVSAFRSEEISHRWDWIADSLGSGLEQHLGLLPGVVVLERTRTRPLSAERDLVDGLPESLMAARLMVDGAYRIQRENNVDTLIVSVHCQRNGQTLLDTNLTGAPDELGVLCREVARRVAGVLGETDCTPMDAMVEAEALALEAQACLADGTAPERALALAEAASALVPGEGRYHLLQLLSLTGVFRNTVGPRSVHWIRSDDLRNRDSIRDKLPYYLEAIREAQRAQMLIEKLWRNPPTKQAVLGIFGTETDFAIYEWWGCCLTTLASDSMVQFEAAADASARDEWESVRQSLLRLFNEWGNICRSKSGNAFSSHLAIAGMATRLCATPADAIAMRKYVWLESVRLFCNGSGVEFTIPPSSVKFGEDTKADEQYGAFLEEMSQNENPVIQATAGVALIYRFGHNDNTPDGYAVAQKYLERLSTVLRKELLPKYGHVGSAFNSYNKIAVIAQSPFINCRLATDTTVEASVRAKYGVEISEAVLQTHTAQTVLEWIGLIKYTADNLRRINDGQRAIQILEAAFEILGNQSDAHVFEARELLRAIRREQAVKESNTTSSSNSTWNVTECLTTQSLSNLGVPVTAQFKSLSASGTGWVLVYTDDAGAGIINVNARFVPTRHQRYRGTLRPRRKQPESLLVGYHACPVVVELGNNTYVGLFGEGILAFRANSEPILWNESSGLPGNDVISLGALNGKLYAIIGATETSSGLVEVDPTTGVGTTLVSARSKTPKNEIDGRPLRAILTDESHQQLLILAGAYRDIAYKLIKPCELFRFDPVGMVSSRAAVALDRLDIHSRGAPGPYMKRSGGGILIGSIVHFVHLSDNLNLISHQQIVDLNYARYPRMTVLGDNLACAYQSELLLFNPHDSKPEYLSDQLTGRKWSTDTVIKDISSAGKVLLVLTADALWRVEAVE